LFVLRLMLEAAATTPDIVTMSYPTMTIRTGTVTPCNLTTTITFQDDYGRPMCAMMVSGGLRRTYPPRFLKDPFAKLETTVVWRAVS